MSNDKKIPDEPIGEISQCPHCGQPLSRWQQIILSVDRVLMCRNCWYRIEYSSIADKKKSGKSDEII